MHCIRLIVSIASFIPLGVIFVVVVHIFFVSFQATKGLSLDAMTYSSRAARAHKLLERIRGTAIQSLCRFVRH